MTYVNPSEVVSPKTSVSSVRVIEDNGENKFSIARLNYDGREVLACRWNGGDGEPYGHPNSRGIPTWFVVPDEMESDVLNGVFSRAREKKKYIFEELDYIKIECEFMKDGGNGTLINTIKFKKEINLIDANLIIELINKDISLQESNIRIFDIDGEGNKTNSPLSMIGGKLHITLLKDDFFNS